MSSIFFIFFDLIRFFCMILLLDFSNSQIIKQKEKLPATILLYNR